MSIKRKMAMAMIAFVLMTSLSGCWNNYLPEKDADSEVDAFFERDYEQLCDVVEFLMAQKESTVYVDFDPRLIVEAYTLKGNRYEKREVTLDSKAIEQSVRELGRKGYICISKSNNFIYFEVWRKHFHAEFDAGFAYSIDGSGNLEAIQSVISQRPMGPENWYYCETDYNEWRANHTRSSKDSADQK